MVIIFLVGIGVGIGILFGVFLNVLVRNLNISKILFVYIILGFVLIEVIVFFGLMVIFLLLFVF